MKALRKRPGILGRHSYSDPFGRILAEASHDKEEILIVDCDVKKMEEVRRNWPFLRDRRIDAYAPITSRFLVVMYRDAGGVGAA